MTQVRRDSPSLACSVCPWRLSPDHARSQRVRLQRCRGRAGGQLTWHTLRSPPCTLHTACLPDPQAQRTWNLWRAHATQSWKPVQRSVSSTSTTFSSCSRAAESLACGAVHACHAPRQWRPGTACLHLVSSSRTTVGCRCAHSDPYPEPRTLRSSPDFKRFR